ncbi:MAG TPA: hypothetical protein VK178_13140 [Opitutaceae bacterium]|nr:hypothetical protein [Opitutaceae bacterium]
MQFDKFAQSVLELPDVEGLCLVEAASSALLYNRMPGFIPEFAFETALRRVCSLYEAVDENLQPTDDYVLKFAGKSLVLRRAQGVILVVFATDSAHLVSLRIVTNIVLKNLHGTPAILAELRSALRPVAAAANPITTPVPAEPPPAPVEPPTSAAGDPAPKRRRVYRGVVFSA